MIFLLLLLQSIIIIIILFAIIYTINKYFIMAKITKDKQNIKLKYKEIKELYKINPNRWKFQNACYAYFDISKCLMYLIGNEIVYAKVSFFTYCLISYKSFLYNHQRKKKESYLNNNTNLKLVLETAQKDIDKIRKQAEKEISEGTEGIVKVHKNLMETLDR